MPDEPVVAAPVTPASTPASTPLPTKDAGRDVLGDALKAPVQARHYNERNQRFERYEAVDVLPVSTSSEAPVSTSTASSTSSAAPVSTSTTVVSTSTATATSDPLKGGDKKLYAGKFETVEAMEAAYAEAQKGFHEKAQEVATLKKQIPPPDPKVIAEKAAEEKAAMLNRIIEDPASIVKEIEQRTQAAIAEQTRINDIREQWRKENSDIAEHETLVGYEAARLLALDPNIETAAMLTQATTNIRATIGKIREAGKQEALSVRSSVTPLADSRIQTPPPSEQPAAAPKSEEQTRDEHVAFLKEQHSRVRGLTR